LEPFLLFLLQSAKGQKPRPSRTTQVNHEDITEKRLNNKLYANLSINKKTVFNEFSTKNVPELHKTPFDSFLFLSIF